MGGQAPDPGVLFKLGGAPPAFSGAPLGADIGGAADGAGGPVHRGHRGPPRRLRLPGPARAGCVPTAWCTGGGTGTWWGRRPGKSEARAFRVDRLSGLQVGSRPGAFTRPAGFRAAAAVPAAPWDAGEGRHRGRRCASTPPSPGGPGASSPPARRGRGRGRRRVSWPGSRWGPWSPSSAGWWGSRRPPRWCPRPRCGRPCSTTWGSRDPGAHRRPPLAPARHAALGDRPPRGGGAGGVQPASATPAPSWLATWPRSS